MTDKYVDVRFEFKEIRDEDIEDYTYLELTSQRRLGTNLTADELCSVTEVLGQSEDWHLNAYTLLAVIEKGGELGIGE